jgi:hypothetical protein
MSASHRWMPFCVFVLIASSTLWLFAPIAFAAAPVIDGVVDVSPILETVLVAVVSGVGAALAWLIRWVWIWLRLSVDNSFRKYVQDALDKAILYARNASAEWAREHGEVVVRNRLIETAAEYVLLAVPGGLKWLGITEDGVRRMVEARLPAEAEPRA